MFLKTVLTLMHPFTPFVTEKIWSFMHKDSISFQKWPEVNKELIFIEEAKTMEKVHNIITKIRKIRAELKVAPGKKIHAVIYAGKDTASIEKKREALMRLARLESLELKVKGKKVLKAKVQLVKNIEIYLPLKDMVDSGQEKKRLEKELAVKEGFAKALAGKLSNKGFLAKAPQAVIQKEQGRLKETLESVEKLKQQLADF